MANMSEFPWFVVAVNRESGEAMVVQYATADDAHAYHDGYVVASNAFSDGAVFSADQFNAFAPLYDIHPVHGCTWMSGTEKAESFGARVHRAVTGERPDAAAMARFRMMARLNSEVRCKRFVLV